MSALAMRITTPALAIALASASAPDAGADPFGSSAAGACKMDCTTGVPRQCGSGASELYKHTDGGRLFSFSSVFGGPFGATCGAGVRNSSASPRTIHLLYDDRSPSSNFSCTPQVSSFSGQTVWLGAPRASSGTGAGELSWTIPASAFGYVVINCFFPQTTGSTPSSILGVTLE